MTMYRIYIQDGTLRLYMVDWIAADGMEHPQFSTSYEYAMRFRRFNDALEYHRKMKVMKYDVHIEDLEGRR